MLCVPGPALVPTVGALVWPGVAGLGDREAGPPVLQLVCTLAADPPSPRNRRALSLFWALKQRQTEITRLRSG